MSTWRRLGRNEKAGVAVGTRVRAAREQERLGGPLYPGRVGLVSAMLPEYPDCLEVFLQATTRAQARPHEMFPTHNLEVEVP